MSTRPPWEPALGHPWRGLLWMCFVLLLAAQFPVLYGQAAGTGDFLGIPHADKVGHVALFALPALVVGLLRARWGYAVLLVHALVSEPVQSWISSGRIADVWDLAADLVGLNLGWWCGLAIAGRVVLAREQHLGTPTAPDPATTR